MATLVGSPQGTTCSGACCLHDRAGAATTHVFRAARNQRTPLRRDHVEALADVLADLRHGAATARAERSPSHPAASGQASSRDCDESLDPSRSALRDPPRLSPARRPGCLARSPRLRAASDTDLVAASRTSRKLVASQFAENDLQLTPPPPTPVPPDARSKPPAFAPQAPSGVRFRRAGPRYSWAVFERIGPHVSRSK
ncbi:hypothetical protein ABH999_000723 [Bradyrhizobium yuanmingense]